MKRFLMAFDTYVIWLLIILYCYYDGMFARLPVPINWVTNLVITINLIIFFLIRSGLNRRFKDPSFTMLQMVIGTMLAMFMAYCFDEGREIMLLLYILIFAFGTFNFKMDFRQFCSISVFAILAYLFVITLLFMNHPKSLNLKIELLNLGTLFTILLWFSFIGGHINGMRKTLIRSNNDLNRANNELQEVNARIKQSEDRYRSMIDSMEEAYYEVDLKGNLKFFNSTAVKNLGYSNEEIVGMNFHHFVDAGDAEKVFQAYHKVFITGEAIKCFDWALINKGGKKMDVEASVALMLDGNGKPIGFRGVVRDVSSRKQGEEALRKSEEKYRTILESIEEAYFEADLKGSYIFFNNYLCAISGYSRAELMGMNYRSYMTQESAERTFKIFNQIYRTGKPRNQVIYEIIKKDGSKAIIEMSVALVREPSGKPIGFRSVGRDVTSRIMAAQAIKETAERYRTIFESTATANIIVDEDTIILLANSNFENLTGYSRDELEGKMSWTYFVVKEDLEKMKKYHYSRRFDPRSVPNSYEFRFTNRKGEVRDLFMNVAVIPGTKESVASIIDITENKKMESHLARAQKMEAIGTLAGGIAHDFNNLLMGILGNISLIRINLGETDPLFERLKNVEDCAKRGSDLTKQLLGFARGGKYEVKPTDIGDFIRKSSGMFGRTRKEITIHHSIQDGLWPVEVDKGQMEQVLLNLYVNAWQAMPEGGSLNLSAENVELDEKTVKPYSIEPGGFVKVSVTDTGVGMDEYTKAHIFEPFFTTKERGHGTGLGLASAYGIVKNHGGYISVESKENQGSSFIIYLPASDKSVEDEYRSEDEIQKGHETVLLIDDEEMILDVGSQMLESLGYKVMTAAGGKLGLKMYEQNHDKIDLVILDMIMPDLGGSATFEGLCRIDPSVKVLLSSGYSVEGQAKEIIQNGCKGFIQKPFSMTELSRKVRSTLTDRSSVMDTVLTPHAGTRN